MEKIKSKLEISLEAGEHHRLSELEGNWKGIAKTWFEKDQLNDESEMSGSIRPVLGGRFMIHEYTGSLNGQLFEGFAILGYSIEHEKFQSVWIDSFHMGTGMMCSEGVHTDKVFSVLGNYGSKDLPEPWGWRTEIKMVHKNKLVITAFNISPNGEEAKALETIYQRVLKLNFCK